MKKRCSIFLALPFILLASCNNEANDSVEAADSANEAKLDSSTASGQAITTDKETTEFLVSAANSGMSEVDMGKLAGQKAVNAKVKDFSTMIVRDHSAANDQVKTLAAQRNVTLPDSISNEKRDDMNNLMKKSGNNFDKAYMDAMVNGHEKTISLFKDAADDVKDTEVKTFIDNTIPKLQMHLDSAKAVRKALK